MRGSVKAPRLHAARPPMMRLIVMLLLCAACGLKPPDKLPVGGGSGGSGGSGTGGGSGGGSAQVTAPPAINTSFFANVGGGANRLLADVGNSRLEIDPTVKDPLTGLAECADL